MHQVSSSSGGAWCPSFVNAYWIDRVMPVFGSVKVPSRSKKIVFISVRRLSCQLLARTGIGPRWAPGCRKGTSPRRGEVKLTPRLLHIGDPDRHAEFAPA